MISGSLIWAATTLVRARLQTLFNIRTPVAIAIGVRGATASQATPATVHYAKIEGESREAKLVGLEGVAGFAELEWYDCSDYWQAPFSPVGNGEFFDWPQLIDLFPWQYSGVQFKRTWPIGEDEAVLRRRWDRLANSREDERKKLFRETSGRRIDRRYRDFSQNILPRISDILSETKPPQAQRYGFRLFDRHYAIVDNRLCDRPRRPLAPSVRINKFVLFVAYLRNVRCRSSRWRVR